MDLIRGMRPSLAGYAAAMDANIIAAGSIRSVFSALFVLIASTRDAVYAVAPWFAKHRGAGKVGRAVAGCSFIGLGLFAALSGRKT